MNIEEEIQKLQAMSVGALRVRWAELYGEPARSRNRIFLWRRLAWRIQELEFGGLSERAKRLAKELARDADLRQRVHRGGLITEGGGPKGYQVVRSLPKATWRDPRLPRPGMVLTRDYQGRRIAVKVLEKGFEYQEGVYASLSAVARAVTGTRWNGLAFFGLGGRRGLPIGERTLGRNAIQSPTSPVRRRSAPSDSLWQTAGRKKRKGQPRPDPRSGVLRSRLTRIGPPPDGSLCSASPRRKRRPIAFSLTPGSPVLANY